MCEQMFYNQVMQELHQQEVLDEEGIEPKPRETEVCLNNFFEKERDTDYVIDFVSKR